MSAATLRRLLLAASLVIAAGPGCASSSRPGVQVLGLDRAGPATGHRTTLLVEVVNRAREPLVLRRLRYALFAAGSDTETARGEAALSQTVAPGAATVLEVPVPREVGGEPGAAHVRAELIAEQNQVVRRFAVRAELGARRTPPADLRAATASRQD
jgi:hypothetical protein